MRYFFFLFIVLPLWANTPLYESLKKPQQTDNYNRLSSFDANETTQKKLFSSELYEYWMCALLQKQYHIYNIDDTKDYIVTDINVNNIMSPEAKALTEDTIYTQVMMVGMIGILFMMPESFTNWDKEQMLSGSLTQQREEHIAAGPVWDEDDWAVNYVGHPVTGAYYYTMARNDGFGIFGSAMYSTMMSTFFWEYGYEAFAEIPSIQDIIFTPLVGSFMGEGLHILELQLDENQGVIWGSKTLGSVSYYFLDPIGSMAGGLSDLFDVSVTMEFTTFEHYQDPSIFRHSNDQADPVRFQDRDYGIILTFY